MRRLGRKASFLALIAVLATAMLGAAYSLWFENLTLTAHVTTGTLDGKIRCGIPTDNETNGWDDSSEPFNSYPQAVPLKDVATTPTGSQNGVHEWDIIVSNTYPGYMLDCEYHLTNTGSVPWHIETEVITVSTGAPPVVIENGVCDTADPFNHGFCIAGEISPTNPAGHPIYVQIEDIRGCQVHHNGEEEGSLFIGVNQSAHENTTYTITISFQVNQWNESLWDNCGDLRGVQLVPPSLGIGEGQAVLPRRESLIPSA
jgi:hypothetical protein